MSDVKGRVAVRRWERQFSRGRWVIAVVRMAETLVRNGSGEV